MIKQLINKYLLVKTIRSQEGKLHFQRWRLFACSFFRIYIHKIYESDLDLHLHNHPWAFFSFLLKGSYRQKVIKNPTYHQTVKQFNIVHMNRHQFHKLTLISPSVYTLVFAYGKRSKWGYLTEDGIIENQEYRLLKKVKK